MQKFYFLAVVAFLVFGLFDESQTSDAFGGSAVACDTRIGPYACGLYLLNPAGCDTFFVNVAQNTVNYSQKIAQTSKGDCSDFLSPIRGVSCAAKAEVDILPDYACAQNIPWVPIL